MAIRQLKIVYYLSIIAATPMPPAVQMLIRILPLPFCSSILAALATNLPPVAANGWPKAKLPPLTFIFVLSIEPRALSNPKTFLQYSKDSQALRLHNT